MSHFTTVETKIKNYVILKQVLEELGYAYEEGECKIRGYRGQLTDACMKIDTKSSYDIGVVQTAEGYSFIADWSELETHSGIEQDSFLKAVNKRYAYHTVLEEVKKYGYNLVEEEATEQQHIKLVLRKWG